VHHPCTYPSVAFVEAMARLSPLPYSQRPGTSSIARPGLGSMPPSGRLRRKSRLAPSQPAAQPNSSSWANLHQSDLVAIYAEILAVSARRQRMDPPTQEANPRPTSVVYLPEPDVESMYRTRTHPQERALAGFPDLSRRAETVKEDTKLAFDLRLCWWARGLEPRTSSVPRNEGQAIYLGMPADGRR
jgi:hypothetical protein